MSFRTAFKLNYDLGLWLVYFGLAEKMDMFNQCNVEFLREYDCYYNPVEKPTAFHHHYVYKITDEYGFFSFEYETVIPFKVNKITLYNLEKDSD